MRPGDKKIRRKVAFIEESRPKMGNKIFSTWGEKEMEADPNTAHGPW